MSLLRPTVPTRPADDAEASRAAAVRFNSLQRPNRRPPDASQRSVHQFRSMRTAGSAGAERTAGRRPSASVVQEKNNNKPECGPIAPAGRSIDKVTDPRRKDVVRSSSSSSSLSTKTTAMTTVPKPAPRTRIPSASVAPPALAHRDTYANLQQLLNGDNDIVNKKVCILYGPDSRLCPLY